MKDDGSQKNMCIEFILHTFTTRISQTMKCDVIYWMLIIMLIVLTLISSVGGGIRPRENFLAEIADINGELHEHNGDLAPAEFLPAPPIADSDGTKAAENQILQPVAIKDSGVPTESPPALPQPEKKVHFEKPPAPAPAPSRANNTGYSVQPFDMDMLSFMPISSKPAA